MAQTHEGALKVMAKKHGLSLAELETRLLTENYCYMCKSWRPHDCFGIDNSRFNNLDRKCRECKNSLYVRKPKVKRESAFKGKRHTPEAKAKMSKARIGNKNRLGKPCTAEQRIYISRQTRKHTPRGEDHPRWKGGANDHLKAIRGSSEYSDWRIAVFERDGYMCQECGDNTGGNLNAHHIKPFVDYPELRFEVDNGITLCEVCHWKTHGKELTAETIYFIEIAYRYALDEFGSKTQLAKAFGIDIRTLNKIINREGQFTLGGEA